MTNIQMIARAETPVFRWPSFLYS